MDVNQWTWLSLILLTPALLIMATIITDWLRRLAVILSTDTRSPRPIPRRVSRRQG